MNHVLENSVEAGLFQQPVKPPDRYKAADGLACLLWRHPRHIRIEPDRQGAALLEGRLVGRQTLEIEFQKGVYALDLRRKRAYIRDRRTTGLSIQRGCDLTGVSRSRLYPEPTGRPADAVILEEIRDVTDEFEGHGYRHVDAELLTAASLQMPRKYAA